MKIGLIGTYDVNNYGDCIFPELYVHELRKRIPGAEFQLYSPRAQPAEILSFDKLDILPDTLEDVSALKSDALILTGGELIGVGHSAGTYILPGNSLSSYLRLWLSPARAAMAPGGPHFIAHCVGATKMPEQTNRNVARALTAGSLVTFRDRFSQNWIRDGNTAYDVAIDPMFLLDGLLAQEAWEARARSFLPDGYDTGKYLVAQVTSSYIRGDFADWVEQVARIAKIADMPVLLLPICHFLFDEVILQHAHARLTASGVRAHLVTGRINVKTTAALIGCSGGYCGTSLHGAVTAVAFARPLAVLGHSMDGKHEGTLRSVGIRGAVCTDPAGLADCFERTSGIDRASVRAKAREMASDGLDRVLGALSGPPYVTPDLPRAMKAAKALAAGERADLKANPALRFKRLVFGLLSNFPRSFKAIKQRRAKRVIRPTFRSES